MKPLRPQLRGLIFKLTLFYVLLSLPCLVLVESGILVFEFNQFMAGVEAGSLTRATQNAARDLAASWPRERADESQSLTNWTQALVLQLQRPRGGLLAQESYILVELSANPLAAAILAPNGQVLAHAPTQANWQLQLPKPDSPQLRNAAQATTAQLIHVADTPYRIRRAVAAIRASDGSLRGYLLIELRLPVPWHRFLLDLSLEWPIVLGYLLVFGIASSFFLATWVTRRLNRVAHAAAAWSQGDFSNRINDASNDELGRLSALLDRMALELKTLMGSRAQLAKLAERQRLARDLHDTVKQKAFALNLQLASARRQLADHPANERIAQAERLSQQMQHDLAHILDELRAPDSEWPFVQRLRLRAEQWAQTSLVHLDMELAEINNLSEAQEQTLLRIVDEALANVLRHSRADRVAIQLRQVATTAQLQIEDNGCGAQAQPRAGMGLGNMRERAESLPDGHFTIRGARDHGTCIQISFSLEAPPIHE